MSVLHQSIVLCLNRVWQPLRTTTVQDALIAMNSGDPFLKAAVAIDVQYERREDGSWDLSEASNLVPTRWEQWIELPVRDFDYVVRTSKLSIRVPTVIVAQNYAKMPKLKKHPTKEAVRERDGSRCQVSGRVLSKKEGNIDHLIPQSRGGPNTWENLVWMDKKLNSEKGDRTLDEMGWQLIKKPAVPREMPASEMIRDLRHRDWSYFIHEH